MSYATELVSYTQNLKQTGTLLTTTSETSKSAQWYFGFNKA
jgi:hypothetical protein